MSLRLGGDERDALADVVAAYDRANEALHRWVDHLANPPRPTKRARELVRGDVVQFNGNRHVVEHAETDRYRPGQTHVCWQGCPSCTAYPADAEIALAAP